LVVERYDRIRSQDEQLQRLHQEDFSQALGIPSRIKYQNEGGPDLANCFQLIRRASTRPARDLIHLFNAVTFNFLIGNNDAHGKDFSLLYTRKGEEQSVQLAPLYDLVSTASYCPNCRRKWRIKIGSTDLPSKLRLSDWKQIGLKKSKPLNRQFSLSKRSVHYLKVLQMSPKKPSGKLSKIGLAISAKY
jgi:serine/threonine-protein kinase HipA